MFDRVRVEPTRGLAAGGGRLRGRRRLRRLRRRRRRLEPRHREGRRPRGHPPGADHGLRQPAGRRGQKPPGPLKPLLGDPHDGGHGLGGHHRGGARHPRPAHQERHLAPLPAPAPGHRRPGADARAAAPRSPRRAASTWSATRSSRSSPSPTTRASAPESPDDRPPYQGANPVSDVWSAKALEYGGRYLRRAVEDADDLEARGTMMLARQPGRHRLRLGRRAHPARLRVSDRVAQARVPAARLPRRPRVRAARLVGDRDRAGGVPLHLRGRPGQAPPRGRADRGRGAPRRRRGHAARRSSPT